MRMPTSLSDDSSDRNVGPHTGISLEPCAATSAPLVTNRRTRSAGTTPRFHIEISVRSAGGVLSAAATGPPPLPSRPWQGAQYRRKLSIPDNDGVNSDI